MRKYHIFFIILSILIFGIIVVGFQMAGNPIEEQGVLADTTRISDFSTLTFQVENYYRTNSALPKNMSQISISSSIHLNDPKTTIPYVYNIISDTSYSFCTEFAMASKGTTINTRPHKKGYDCIVYTIPTYMVVAPTPFVEKKLVGYWKLDELNPGYGVFDEVVEKNDGIISNVGTVDGKLKKAASFKGVSDSYIDVTQNNEIALISGDFTLGLWTKRYDTGSRAIASTTNSADGGFGMFVGNNGEVYCRTSDMDGSFTDSYTSVSTQNSNRLVVDSGWHHLAIVKNGSSCRVYIDGQDSTTIVGYHKKLVPNSNPLTLGGVPNHLEQMYSGVIDEVKLYNYARSKKEILEDMKLVSP